MFNLDYNYLKYLTIFDPILYMETCNPVSRMGKRVMKHVVRLLKKSTVWQHFVCMGDDEGKEHKDLLGDNGVLLTKFCMCYSNEDEHNYFLYRNKKYVEGSTTNLNDFDKEVYVFSSSRSSSLSREELKNLCSQHAKKLMPDLSNRTRMSASIRSNPDGKIGEKRTIEDLPMLRNSRKKPRHEQDDYEKIYPMLHLGCVSENDVAVLRSIISRAREKTQHNNCTEDQYEGGEIILFVVQLMSLYS